MFRGKCRYKMVVNKAICLETDKYYIGQTQNNVKERLSKHVSETTKLIKEGPAADSFAKHFAELCLRGRGIQLPGKSRTSSEWKFSDKETQSVE